MSKCQQCEAYEFKQSTGCWPNGQAFARWAMWGCTCEPGAADARARELRRWTD